MMYDGPSALGGQLADENEPLGGLSWVYLPAERFLGLGAPLAAHGHWEAKSLMKMSPRGIPGHIGRQGDFLARETTWRPIGG